MKFGTKLFFAIVGIFTIVLFSVRLWLKYTFGKITMNQIAWHLMNSMKGTDTRICLSAVVMLICAMAVSIGWLCIIYRGELIGKKLCVFLSQTGFRGVRNETVIKCINYQPYLLGIIMCCCCFFLVKRVICDWNLVGFYYSVNADYSAQDKNGRDFFKSHVKVPEMGAVHFDDKKNLLVVMAESLEKSYSPLFVSHEETLTPNLDRLSKQYYSVLSMYEGFGLNWTIAALSGWHFGLPLKVPSFFGPNTYDSHRGFLPNAQSVFDVLAYHGYKQVLLMGSDSNFSGMKNLFEGHGNFQILDSVYWKKQGYPLQEHQGVWEYSDKFILERAREEYRKLDASDEPFVLLVQTIDTHAPNGYCPAEHAVYGDIRDAIAEADRLLGGFVQSILEDKTKPVALMIVGDHNLMGHHTFLKNVKDRKIYGVFMGDIPKIPEMKSRQIMTAMDMAPTLLEAAGGRWKHHQYGLGVSIFSKESSLAEQMGMVKLNDWLERPSAYYSSFY